MPGGLLYITAKLAFFLEKKRMYRAGRPNLNMLICVWSGFIHHYYVKLRG